MVYIVFIIYLNPLFDNNYVYAIVSTYKGHTMIELGISQAQAQFTQLLSKTVLIIDKKAHHKKAVILPYEEYQRLLAKASANTQTLDEGIFSQFVGILDDIYETSDSTYNVIVN